MFRLGDDRALFEIVFNAGYASPRAHAARARHPCRLRPVEERDGEIARPRPPDASNRGIGAEALWRHRRLRWRVAPPGLRSPRRRTRRGDAVLVTLAGLGEPALRHLATRLAVALLQRLRRREPDDGRRQRQPCGCGGPPHACCRRSGRPGPWPQHWSARPRAGAPMSYAAAATLSAGLPWPARGPQRSWAARPSTA